jgi:hypothetical protein
LDSEAETSLRTSGGLDVGGSFHFGHTCSAMYAKTPAARHNKLAALQKAIQIAINKHPLVLKISKYSFHSIVFTHTLHILVLS